MCETDGGTERFEGLWYCSAVVAERFAPEPKRVLAEELSDRKVPHLEMPISVRMSRPASKLA
jgi:hypothetical protein